MKNVVENEPSKIESLSNQLSIARKELQNIRNDMKKLNYSHQKEMEEILKAVRSWKCKSCSTENKLESLASEEECRFAPIGVVSTSFSEKRGIPRQPGICANSKGKIILFNTVFTNPEHALEGLQEFSHMWILFHFHKNDSTHIRAKVSPPRLNGMKTGVFGTRSPHRPSPIGLSLVNIDFIRGNTVYFSGVDMLDGTPVIDIKPYIPQYDDPANLDYSKRSKEAFRNSSCGVDIFVDPASVCREAPDGEECETAAVSSKAYVPKIRVPRWISDPIVSHLEVEFSDKALSELVALKGASCGSDVEAAIANILREDPRSVYVRERYANQFYTFLIERLHVSCKFDDERRTVHVYKVAAADAFKEWKNSFDSTDDPDETAKDTATR